MADLTISAIEHLLDKKLAGFPNKADLSTVETRIIKRIDEAQEQLARLVADTVAVPFTRHFEELEKKLDVAERVQKVEQQIQKISRALQLEL